MRIQYETYSNADHLRMIERKLNAYGCPQTEYERLEYAWDDVMLRMTPEERQAWNDAKSQAAKTPEQIKAERDAIVAQMNENRDKPSH